MIYSATGHRPNVLFEGQTTQQMYSKENKRLLTNFAKEVIQKLRSENTEEIKIIMGCAQGWDSAVGWAAYELQIPYLAAVPFEGMEVKWPKESQQEFKLLLEYAAKVVYVCDPGYAPKKFFERDKYMVDNGDKVLALHNGSTEGGTAITVQYAQKVNKPIINVWEEWIKYAK